LSAHRNNRDKPVTKTPTASTASLSSRSTLDKVQSWYRHHQRIAWESLSQLLDSWFTSLMTWLVIGIAIALPTILYLLLGNLTSLGGDWDGQPRMSVYLKAEVTDSVGRVFMQSLLREEEVLDASYISADEALVEFQARSGLANVIASIGVNPLPAVIEITPAAQHTAGMKLLVVRLEGDERVESVDLDLQWIERLLALVALGERFVSALSFFLGLGVLLSIGNTIRLAIENRRAEIEVVKLVGGTDSFVRRPFLYLGFWYGAGGALMAWLLIESSFLFLSGPIERLMESYNDAFSLSGLGFVNSLFLFAGGSLLGVLGAALAVSKHLHSIEPK
jgi:cell division transport system permease protein